ncbi:MAG: biopolymer transporter ExbD [Myxococcota bacterium]|nr:biopolymer transporter ExbD [Myxococcota bacterium]
MSDNNDQIPEDINSLPDPADLHTGEAGLVREKRLSRRTFDEGEGLNINSLMDIMTILLVFLLKSYGSDPVKLKQAPDLKPPFSSAQLKPEQSSTVTLTMNNILVNDQNVLSIVDGKVSEADTSGGGNYFIDPLGSVLEGDVENQRAVAKFNANSEFTGLLTIICDRHVPFSLLSQVMYTAGQVEFSKFKFLVVKGGA